MDTLFTMIHWAALVKEPLADEIFAHLYITME